MLLSSSPLLACQRREDEGGRGRKREDERGSHGADDESPLWTVSFLAECVQWARARSWNLANETHPPRVPPHPTGWQGSSGGDDWLAESSAGCCQSRLELKDAVLRGSIAHRETKRSEMYTLNIFFSHIFVLILFNLFNIVIIAVGDDQSIMILFAFLDLTLWHFAHLNETYIYFC